MASNLGLPPGTPPTAARVRGYLSEVLGLSPADVRGVGIRLQASLSNTSPATDSYKVPSDQELVIFSIQGYMRFPTLNTENTAILSYLNLDPSERWIVKSQNCIVQLENIDRSLKIFDNAEVPLGAIMPPMGSPMFFPVEAPMLVPSSHNIRGTFTLQDSTSAIVGNSTVYGILMTGALIPKMG